MYIFSGSLRVIATMLIALLVSGTSAASADSYPSKPVRFVVPFAPGGSSDVIARRFAERLSARLGQPIIVDNRPGAASNIGSDAAQRATPDGYTLVLMSNQLLINQVFGPKPSFDATTGLEPVSMIARLPFIVAAGNSFSINSIEELMPTAQLQPNKYTIASAQLEVFAEMLRRNSGMLLLHVPYRGGSETIIDTIAGRVDMTLTLGPVLLPQVRGGKMKPLGIAAKEGLKIFSTTKTFRQMGIPFEAGYWYGVSAPPGTPRAIVARLAEESRRVVESPEFANYLSENGGLADVSGPSAMRDLIKNELNQWNDLAKEVPALVRTGDQK